MANQNKDSKTVRNLKSAANSTIRTTGKIASKGTAKTFKWLTTNHSRPTFGRSIMEITQSINYHKADMALSRRMQKRYIEKTKNYDYSVSVTRYKFDNFKGWMIDHSIYVLELIWGFFQPILSELFSKIMVMLIVIVVNVVFFGVLFILILPH